MFVLVSVRKIRELFNGFVVFVFKVYFVVVENIDII